MKKIIAAILCLGSLTSASAFAAIKITGTPDQPATGQDYVGQIVAATYNTQADGQKSMLVITQRDDRSDSNLPGLTLELNDNDLPFGMTLANSVGKKLAIMFDGKSYQINSVSVVTDEYWYGNNKK